MARTNRKLKRNKLAIYVMVGFFAILALFVLIISQQINSDRAMTYQSRANTSSCTNLNIRRLSGQNQCPIGGTYRYADIACDGVRYFTRWAPTGQGCLNPSQWQDYAKKLCKCNQQACYSITDSGNKYVCGNDKLCACPNGEFSSFNFDCPNKQQSFPGPIVKYIIKRSVNKYNVYCFYAKIGPNKYSSICQANHPEGPYEHSHHCIPKDVFVEAIGKYCPCSPN